MLALINPRCDYGRGLRAWRRIEPALLSRHRGLVAEEIPPVRLLPLRLAQAVDSGERRFIAAGGDGTVNVVANALMGIGHDVALGAVALGSSNDYHKPLRDAFRLGGVPAKLHWEAAELRDVIRVQHRDTRGAVVQKACMINAGIGITAHANAVYNGRLPAIARLQRVSVEAAILASVVHALRTFTPLPCDVAIDGSPPTRLALTNLAVLKSPHVGGALCYDTPVRPSDGTMKINICMNMTRMETVRTLINLYRHRFSGSPKTFCRAAATVKVTGATRFALELDGEVVSATEACFQLVPGALRCCP
ncbi:MAG: hypothetical protein MUE60_09165 [Candidatus Eisenbacteria bacterium]|jgi:diacylglycerol kinase family enzyme|nr:hypothetical protein [Candidatus Eisenbacteria bacterium]